MALTDENGSSGFVMPVSPLYGGGYGNNGGGLFGNNGDLSWLILLLLCGWGGGFGMGGFGMGGMMWPMMMGGMGGGFGLDYLYPWLNNSQHISDGFRDQQLQTSIGTLQNSVTSGFGDVQLGIAGVNSNLSNGFAGVNLNLCQTGNGIVNAVTGAQNAVTQQLYSNELASLNRSFAEQTANANGFNGVQAGIADLRYTEATENCATRTASAQNTRDIIDAQNRGTQAILDKLCALELDGVKGQLAAAQRENVGLQNQLNMAAFQKSQAEQNALFAQGMNNEVDALYNRLKNCPVNTVPVAGNTPLFSCNPGFNNGGCGCNGNLGFAG